MNQELGRKAEEVRVTGHVQRRPPGQENRTRTAFEQNERVSKRESTSTTSQKEIAQHPQLTDSAEQVPHVLLGLAPFEETQRANGKSVRHMMRRGNYIDHCGTVTARPEGAGGCARILSLQRLFGACF